MLVLLGVVVVIVGFAIRIHPLVIVLAAGLVTGLLAGMDLVAIISALGRAFNANRFMAIPWLVLPVIGILERAGLRERAREIVSRMRADAVGRMLLLYFVLRQVAAALGMTSLGGQAQMVRPLLAPMAEAAAENRLGRGADAIRFRLRAHAAAVDNIALFFGEDIFVAIGSVLLMKGFLAQNGLDVAPLRLSLWAVPTAIVALLVHGTRLLLLDRELRLLPSAEGNARTSKER
jgi:uncharacterized membrane protein